jgi:hypothetical protein
MYPLPLTLLALSAILALAVYVLYQKYTQKPWFYSLGGTSLVEDCPSELSYEHLVQYTTSDELTEPVSDEHKELFSLFVLAAEVNANA